MAARPYGQHCAVAKSLDVVGDRWSLLVVRELLDGPRRYGDLLAALAPIATDMLAGRLRDLEKAALVCKRALPKPASGATYELTADGLALEDVINAFARWGRHLIEDRTPGDFARPEWLARAVSAYVRDDRSGPPLTLRLDTPEGSVTVCIDADGVRRVADDAAADVTLSGAAETLAAAMNPARTDDLIAAGRLRIDGDARTVRQLATVFAGPRARV
jgi:DNA-binding HxlR family transcriptional regulator